MQANDREKQEKAQALAAEVIALAKSELLMGLRFLDTALYRLKESRSDTDTYATDGISFFYSARHVLLSCREEKETVPRDILHILLHCIFAHPFGGGRVDDLLWDLAADIAVENVINELHLERLRCKRQNRQDRVVTLLQNKVRLLTAERIYRYFLEHPLSEEEIARIREDFYADDHGLWYMPKEETAAEGENLGDLIETEIQTRGQRRFKANPEAASLWQKEGRSIHMDMETFAKDWGDKAGILRETLRLLLREKCDYRDFLKRFAVSGETMEINKEEFDYIFYTYGLTLYGNMPLIEPLEYREETKVRDFVIAIDTSASVSGKIVRQFLQKTYDILSDTESFFTKVNIHIIQCDAKIREDAVISSKEDFAEYIEHLEIKGFGGTDFRPVFTYVNNLWEQHHFEDLKGLLYFSDGFGEYPYLKPPYETAFVFLAGEHNNFEVPPWAMKVVLKEDEVMIV